MNLLSTSMREFSFSPEDSFLRACNVLYKRFQFSVQRPGPFSRLSVQNRHKKTLIAIQRARQENNTQLI